MELVTFTNDYIETINDISEEEKRLGLLIRTYIDGYPLKEEDDEKYAKVVATISTTVHGDTVIDYHDNAYRLNDKVNILIVESIEHQKKYFENEVMK